MSEHQRVAMPNRSGWIADEDVNVSSVKTPRIGRRYSMDVDESVLAQIGARALEHAIQRLGEHVAYEHQHEIHSAVSTLVHDIAWAKPIIEQEMRRAVREMVLSLWSDDEKQNLRDWFDLFTAKVRGNEPDRS